MAYGVRTTKSEHAGAKDRGRKSGFYGYRFHAKAVSKRVRRLNDRRAVREGLGD